MKFIHSLSAKYLLLSMLILAFFTLLVTATFQLTRHSQGESRKMNLAGRQRMLLFDLASHFHFLSGALSGLESDAEIDRHRAEIERASRQYATVLYGLRDGDKTLNLEAIHRLDHKSQAILVGLIDRWETTQRPLLQSLVHAPLDIRRNSCTACHAVFSAHFDELDTLATSIGIHYDRELQRFAQTRFAILTVAFLVAAAIGVYVRRQLIRPITAMKQAADRIRQKDFAVHLPVTGQDEISALALAINEMAATLAALHQEQEENTQRLSMLHQVGAVAAGRILRLDALLNELLDEIFSLKLFSLQKKGGIFLYDNKKKVLTLAASRGYGPEQLKNCGTVLTGQCLCGLSAEHKTVIRATSSSDHRHSLTYEGMPDHGHIILPLLLDDHLLGVLCLYLPAGRTLSADEEASLASVADIVAVALQNSLTHRQAAMLAQALDSSRDLIMLTDPQGTIIHTNPMVVDYFGCQPEEMIGRHVLTTHSPNNPAGLDQEIFSQTLADGWDGELLLNKRDGSEYPALLTTAPVRDAQGEVVALLGIARDITEHKRLEEIILQANQNLGRQVAERTAELEEAKLLAEGANRAKSEFLANMSHELRTPLTAIIGFAEVMRDGMTGPTTDNQQEYLSDIMDSGRHLLSLINDILDLSKVEAGQTELDLTTIPIAGLVEHSLILFKEKAMKHGITLAVDLAGDIGEIRADERKIRQVLVNLLANAMKFTHDNGRVTVTAVRNNGGVRLTVEDTGIGIASEDLPRLFQPFQQLETELTRKYPGTGLGLSLCRRFLELHGGRIWAESELGVGSRFIFVLPREPIACQTPAETSILAGTRILPWQAGRQHLNRILSSRREGVDFALLRFQSAQPLGQDDFLAAAVTIEKMSREHDLIMADADRQFICLAIMGVDRGLRDETITRFTGLLKGACAPFAVTAAFSPDDGDSFDGLVAALDSRLRQGERPEPSGLPT